MNTDKLKAIEAELAAINEDIGADEREPDRLTKDAAFLLMHREGVNVETLCMMLTDLTFALKEERAKKGT